MHSIRWKIVLAYLLITVFSFAFVDGMTVQLVGEYLYTQKVHEEERAAGDIASRVTDLWNGSDAAGLYSAITSLSEDGSRILLCDIWGVVQADSDSVSNGTRLRLAEVARVLGGEASAFRYYSTGAVTGVTSIDISRGTAYGVHAVALTDEDVLSGVLVYITSADELFTNVGQIRRNILLTLLAIAALAVLAVVLSSGIIMRPLEELKKGIDRMAHGDLHARVNVRGSGEFAELGRAFNNMSEQIEQLDRSRSEFVSNASHELKTPLSAAKILVQSLMFRDKPDPAMQAEFLQDIDREIDHMSGLVSDLLSLVRIDSGKVGLKCEEFPLGTLVQSTVHRLLPFAEDRSVELRCDVWEENVRMTGDRVKLEQVIYNLTDNAIKYTPAGGAVRVELKRSGKNALISVTDNGIGIPQADLSHIFERFYRVDKARDRETGGTGLGLAIVKQIVELHGGTVSATSQENVGTIFRVELPLSGPRSEEGNA